MTDVAVELAAAIKYALDKNNVGHAPEVPQVAAEVVKPLVEAMQKLTAELDAEIDTAWEAFNNLAEMVEVHGVNQQIDAIISKYRTEKDNQDGVAEEGVAEDGGDRDTAGVAVDQ
jgi:hypothetical protein